MALTEAEKRAQDKYRFGGNREAAIQRDGEKCVECSMTRDEHQVKYGRDIEVNHIDKNGSCVPKEQRNNSLENLETLCHACHLTKDQTGTIHKDYVNKLTLKQVVNIKHIGKAFPAHIIAERYGVSKATIDRIRIGTYPRKGLTNWR